MTLDQYLYETGKTIADFAKTTSIGITTLRKILNGQRRIPRPEIMIKIYKGSGGLVQPNDFYNLPDLKAMAMQRGDRR